MSEDLPSRSVRAVEDKSLVPTCRGSGMQRLRDAEAQGSRGTEMQMYGNAGQGCRGTGMQRFGDAEV